MSMTYAHSAITEAEVPRVLQPVFQHLLDTYADETSKVISVWREFSEEELAFRPHPPPSRVIEIFKHQLLSERRFFGEFLGLPDPRHQTCCPRSSGWTVALSVCFNSPDQS